MKEWLARFVVGLGACGIVCGVVFGLTWCSRVLGGPVTLVAFAVLCCAGFATLERRD